MVSRLRVLLLFILFGLTWYLLQISATVTLVPIKKSFASFPHTIGSYHLARSFQSSSEVLELLGVDDYIQYNYLNTKGARVNLYAGFYRAVGVTGSYHSPKNCLPGGGWGIDKTRQVIIDGGVEGRSQETVSEMLIRNGDDYQVVLYWYQNRGRVIASEYWEKVYLVLDALFKGRRDGTFVRIMTVANDGDIEAARQRARNFASLVMPVLANHLPGAKL